MGKEAKNNQLTTIESLPNLHEKQAQSVSLVADYWTPETPGETKRVYIVGISSDMYDTDDERGEIELDCLYMIEQLTDGSFKAVKNAAKRLVAAIENAIKAGEIQTVDVFEKSNGEILPTGLEITFTGKKKNKTNGFQTDRFEVKKLA